MTVPTICCLLAGGAVSERFNRRRVLDRLGHCPCLLGHGPGSAWIHGCADLPAPRHPLRHVQRRRSVLHASIRSDRAQHRRPRRPTRRQRARPVRSAASAPARRPCARRRAGRRPRIPDRLRRRRRHVCGIDRRNRGARRSASTYCGRRLDTCRDQARLSLRSPPRLALGGHLHQLRSHTSRSSGPPKCLFRIS